MNKIFNISLYLRSVKYFLILSCLLFSFPLFAQNAISIYSLNAYCDGNSHTLNAVYLGSEPNAQAAFPAIVNASNWTTTQKYEIDAAAINQAAFDAIHHSANTVADGGAFLSSNEGLITIGTSATANGTCIINTTLNFTMAVGRPIIFDARGATIICRTVAIPCLDMTGSIGMDIIGLTIVGSNITTMTTPPVTYQTNIGILMGRTSDGTGSNYNKFEHLTLDGAFTFADFVNVAGEDNTIYDGVFSNSAGGSSGTTTQVFCYHCKTAWITGTRAVMTIRWAVTTSRFRDAGSSVWVVG